MHWSSISRKKVWKSKKNLSPCKYKKRRFLILKPVTQRNCNRWGNYVQLIHENYQRSQISCCCPFKVILVDESGVLIDVNYDPNGSLVSSASGMYFDRPPFIFVLGISCAIILHSWPLIECWPQLYDPNILLTQLHQPQHDVDLISSQ